MTDEKPPVLPIRVHMGRMRTTLWRYGARYITDDEVRAWMADAGAGRRLTTPSVEQCQAVTEALNAIIDRCDPVTPASDPQLATAAKFGGRFVRAHETFLATAGARWNERAQKTLRRAIKANQEALELLKWRPPKRSWHEDARSIAEIAQAAWAKSGRAPSSTAEGDPLCVFVTNALNEVQSRISAAEKGKVKAEMVSASAVREALLGRRGARF